MAHASLGMLRVRQHKPDEARQKPGASRGGKFSELPDALLLCFALQPRRMPKESGIDLSGGNGCEDTRRTRRPFELRLIIPNHIVCWPFVNLVSVASLKESIESLRHALAIAPARNDLLLMLAQVPYAKRDFRPPASTQNLSKNTLTIRCASAPRVSGLNLQTIEEQAAKYRAFKEQQAKNPNNRSSEPAQVNVLGESEVT